MEKEASYAKEQRILDTFVEKHSFEGIAVIPFCTSGGSVSEEELQSLLEGLE